MTERATHIPARRIETVVEQLAGRRRVVVDDATDGWWLVWSPNAEGPH
jgi:hypothetical protein